jgi:hypothetical protein
MSGDGKQLRIEELPLIRDDFIIRAGFHSEFRAGSASADVAGTFTEEDAEDVIAMLEITIRSVKRQMRAPGEQELEPLPIVDDRNQNPAYACWEGIGEQEK